MHASRPIVLLGIFLLPLAGCERKDAKPAPPANAARPAERGPSLADGRRGFQTRLVRRESAGEPVPEPPADLFRTVRYRSPAGELAAYLSRPPTDGKKRPAIIWLFGGFSNGIGDTAWEPAPPENDQSARAFREAGIVMMYPSLRGGNDNPGHREGFFGEVDDVLAAADFLAARPEVDPKRIYLGGHSTGGTLVLLAAASTDRFRAVFSFGPVDDVAGYGDDNLPFDTSDGRELELRSPARWINSVRSPTFVLEGARRGNADALMSLSRRSRNVLVRCHLVQGADHRSILAPATRLAAAKILADTGPATNIEFTAEELNRPFAR